MAGTEVEQVVLLDYEAARSDASEVRRMSNDFMSLFDDQDSSMSQLYGQIWQSAGSEETGEYYKRMFKAHYEPIFKKLVATSNVIITAADRMQSGDQQGTAEITGA